MFKDKGTDKILIGAGVFEPPLDRPTTRTLFDEDRPSWSV